MGYYMENGVAYGAGITPITIEGTLVAGATSIVFTNDAILEGERYNVYAWDKPTVKPTNMVVSGHTLTLTYPAQSTDTRIKVVINEDVNTLMFDDTNKADKSDLTSIFATGSTNTTGSTISAGTYFYLNGLLVRAKADIATNATFTLNTNYEEVIAGALNEVYTGGNSVQTFINIAYAPPYHSQTITLGYNNKMDDTTFVLPKGKWILRLVGYNNMAAGNNWFRLLESTDPTPLTARVESAYKIKVNVEMIGDTILVEVAQDTTFSLYYYMGGSGTTSIISYQYMVKGFKLSD